MMTMAGKRGGEAKGGNGDAKATEYGASSGKLIEFTGRNRPKGAMLSMDSDPLEFDSKRRFFAGHLEVESLTSIQYSSPQAHALQRHA